MPTDLTTLLDFETNVETAAKLFLATATGLETTSLYATLDQDNLVLPRISVAFESAGAIDPVDVKNTESDQFEYRKYEGKISIQVVSDASINNSQTEHRTIRAKIRAAMLLNAENWTAVDDLNNKILPYYDVNYMRPAGTQYVVEGDLAISILEYKINLTIRNDQFPN